MQIWQYYVEDSCEIEFFFCFVIMLVLSEIFNTNGGDKHFLSFRMLVNLHFQKRS